MKSLGELWDSTDYINIGLMEIQEGHDTEDQKEQLEK